MKYKIGAAFGLVLTISTLAWPAHGQQPSEQAIPTVPNNIELTGSTDDSSEPLYKQLDDLDINDAKLWIFFALVTTSGAFGGAIYYLMNFEEIQELLDEEAKLRKEAGCPRKFNYVLANTMCCMSKMSIGAAAAPAAILLLRPESPFALLATSIVVGSAGSAILRNVQEKMVMTIAKTKAEKEATRQQALLLNDEQSIQIGKLIKIVEHQSKDDKDWEEVKKIARKLKANCQTCQATFSKSKPSPEDSEDIEDGTEPREELANGVVSSTEAEDKKAVMN